MIKKLTSTDGHKLVVEYGNRIIEKEGSDFTYYSLNVFACMNYEESEAAKLNYELLIKEIKKYDIDAVEFDNQIYVSDESMADLIYYISEDFGIEPIDGLI